ncbi:hypothetical protein [uncultured Pseudophaeobacter sp.]|jgi:hypothetical protein|uniref:hypothetical protein n=1 Tax=uncultured Pseudophaeobacter sp. TaxID=1759421 RepID=UPI0025EE1FFF|nr:hypothetical protein [uncultured Pseudophaeobacter sp.]
MAKPVKIDIDPITLADRLRKSANTLTGHNMHTEAFLAEMAAEMIAELSQSKTSS